MKVIRESHKVCNQACVNAIEKACFPYLQALNRDWNLYLNDVLKLASRLKTSFNIELAVKPINIQISEAIMIFQESGVLISQTVSLFPCKVYSFTNIFRLNVVRNSFSTNAASLAHSKTRLAVLDAISTCITAQILRIVQLNRVSIRQIPIRISIIMAVKVLINHHRLLTRHRPSLHHQHHQTD